MIIQDKQFVWKNLEMEHVPFNSLSHFSINVQDVDRSVSFYESVFGWKCSAWGPPGFFMIDTGSSVHGSIQKVQADPFETVIGNFECTIAVDDVDRVCAAIVENGGEVTLPKVTIPGVADIARVKDCEGNTFSLAHYL
ncbi:MAG: VOC family protein [Fimbriimonadaceae bacterium]